LNRPKKASEWSCAKVGKKSVIFI